MTMQMNAKQCQRVAAVAAICLAVFETAYGAKLSLATVPQGRGGREPAPNIIVSVDDSGSMGTAGINALKAALTNAFSATAVADDSIRLGFQAMWRCRGLAAAPWTDYGGTCPDNRIKRFSGTHRTNFNNWVNSLQPWSNTPSHMMIRLAGEYMKSTGVNGPFASNPGVQETPLLACRKSFLIFMTDGEWNSEWSYGNNPTTAGDADGTSITLPDGTAYDTSAANTQTRIYRDTQGGRANVDGGASTMADYAFMYWATDLQPTINNEIRPIIRESGVYNAGTAASPYEIQEYWNPKNNPATWQNLITYTIGFNAASNLSTTGAANHPWWGGSTWSGGDYNNLLKGTVPWGDPFNNGDARVKELWHMAINGRGKMIPATNAAALSAAFAEIVNQILQDTNTPLTSIALNTQTSRSDTQAYVGGYNANNWSGELSAYGLSTTGTVNANAIWQASSLLNSATPANRRILTHNGTGGTTFTWTELSDEQRWRLVNGGSTPSDPLNPWGLSASEITVGQSRLNYLRGDRSGEQSNGGTLRNRASRLGDIVNSGPWPVGKPNMGYLDSTYRSFRTSNATRTAMVYLGANDGMLHGFSASDGVERLAYVPKGVFHTLSQLPQTSYTHRYYVDGKPFTSDFYTGSVWKTALVGTLAGGGKGYFVLDVTSPSGFSSATPASLVLVDNTDASPKVIPAGQTDTFDPDVGHMYSPPVQDSANSARVVQIAKLNNDRWALLLGNGVNSTDEKAVLLIQYLDGNKELIKIYADSTAGGGNGLSHPQVIDLNGDGKADIAYAGDLKGNLWKFDLRDATASNWAVAFTGSPLYVAKDSAGNRQPITTAPTWAYNPNGGINLVFGTGRDMTAADPAATSQQTLYSVWDNTQINNTVTPPTLTGGTVIAEANSRSALESRSQTQTVVSAAGTFYKTTATAVVYTGTGAKRGWYFDYPTVSERSLTNGFVFDKRLALIPSIKPGVGSQTSSSTESCDLQYTPADNYITVLDAVTGIPYKSPLFDDNGGGFTGTETNGLSRMATGADPISLINKSHSDAPYESRSTIVSSRPGANMAVGVRVFDDPAKVGWRQLQ